MAKIREEEMDRIKAILNQYDHSQLLVDHLEPNQMVTIASGVFIDRQGRVLESKGNKTIILLEELGIRIEIDHGKNILHKKQPNNIITRNFVQQKV
jgi:transcription antitermination factor NusG